jgi:hypothetical protein
MPQVTRTVRAVAHVHSEWSDDAAWPLTRIAAAFARRRYSVVLLSEHSRGFSGAKWHEYMAACTEASTTQVTLVPGIEYGDADNVVHIPVWGNVPFFGEAPDIQDLLATSTEAGGTAVLAHPWRREAWRRIDPQWGTYLTAVEVWNRKYDGVTPNHDSFALADNLQVQPFVSLDFHTRRQFFPLSLAIGLTTRDGAENSGAITPDEVYTALRATRFAPYALGVPLAKFRSGAPRAALRGLEVGRRAVARLAR